MILVTGGTGLLGLHLLIELIEFNSLPVKAIYRCKEKLEVTKAHFLRINSYSDATEKWHRITWVKADINDIPSLENAFKNCTQIYHCAALVSFVNRDFNILKKINIEGTTNLINLSIDAGIEKFCYVSSIASLNLNPNELEYTEDSKWNNEIENSGYAISKHGGEMEVWRGIQEGLNAVIVNPGYILGAGFYTQSSSKLFNEIKKGLSFYTNGSTGFIGVQDCVKIMIQLMDQKKFSNRFILVSENKTYKEIIDSISDAINSKAPQKNISKKWVLFFSKIESFFCSILSTTPKIPLDMVHSITTHATYSNQKIEEHLNYTFEPISSVIKNVAKDFTSLRQ